MKISAYLNTPKRHFGTPRAFEILAEIGYDCVDSNTTHFDTRKPFANTVYHKSAKEFEQVFRDELNAARAVGMTIGQTHAPFPTYHPDPQFYHTYIEVQKKALYATALLEAPYMVIHPSQVTAWSTDNYPAYSRSLNYALFEQLLPVAHDCGVKLALENMPGNKYTCGTIDALCDYIDMMDSPDLVACFDTGHALLSAIKPEDATRQLGDRLQVLHVHDNHGITPDKQVQPVSADQHLPPLMGKIDWNAFGQALVDIGYAGTFSFESVIRAPKDYYQPVEAMQYAFAKTLTEKFGL